MLPATTTKQKIKGQLYQNENGETYGIRLQNFSAPIGSAEYNDITIIETKTEDESFYGTLRGEMDGQRLFIRYNVYPDGNVNFYNYRIYNGKLYGKLKQIVNRAVEKYKEIR